MSGSSHMGRQCDEVCPFSSFFCNIFLFIYKNTDSNRPLKRLGLMWMCLLLNEIYYGCASVWKLSIRCQENAVTRMPKSLWLTYMICDLDLSHRSIKWANVKHLNINTTRSTSEILPCWRCVHFLHNSPKFPWPLTFKMVTIICMLIIDHKLPLCQFFKSLSNSKVCQTQSAEGK